MGQKYFHAGISCILIQCMWS